MFLTLLINAEHPKSEMREISVAKQRNGLVGDIKLAFFPGYMRFIEEGIKKKKGGRGLTSCFIRFGEGFGDVMCIK